MSNVDSYGDALDMACKKIGTQFIHITELEQLAKEMADALEEISTGNARKTRKVEKCEHGQYGYEHCESCLCEFASKALSRYREVCGGEK